MDYIIREMNSLEFSVLDEFLYEAIFQRDEMDLLPRLIIKNPEIHVYIKDFGTLKDDYCLCTEVDHKIVGAVWVRNISGFGSIDNTTPEFAISLFREYRGYGIGTEMMKRMLAYLKAAGYSKASLAVQKDNYAVRMYLSVGFQIIDENEEEYIMVHDLK